MTYRRPGPGPVPTAPGIGHDADDQAAIRREWMSFINELKRRNVIKVAGAYLALAWLVLQLTSIAVPESGLPAWTLKFVIWFGVIGFPCALVFAWVFEMTPDGLKREIES